MCKFMKIIVILMALIFLLTSFAGAVEVSKKIEVKDTEDENEVFEEIEYTVYRFSPDGEITPVDIKILLKDGDDLWSLIEQKCDELFEQDLELQNYINTLVIDDTNDTDENETDTNNSRIVMRFCRVRSHGRGFHFKTKTHVSILTKFKWFKIGIPKVFVYARKPIVYCRYPNDPKAKTVVTPLLDKNSTVVINGSHSVTVKNLVGYATWHGRFCFSPFNLLPRAFSGIASKVKIKTLYVAYNE